MPRMKAACSRPSPRRARAPWARGAWASGAPRKANQNFLQLQDELGDLENKIAAARRFLNNAVAEYNASIQKFPAALFAGAMGFQPAEMFQLSETEKAEAMTPPKVSFGT
jgi:L-serine deaminase